MKPVYFVGSAYKDLKSLPGQVQRDIGFALYEAQVGGKSYFAKPLKGFHGAGVLEVIEDHDGDTFRAVYTVKFEDGVYVLHVFQKKSKSGSEVPKREMEKIRDRLEIIQELVKRKEPRS